MKQKQLNRLSVYRFKRFTRKKYGAFCSLRRVVNIGVVMGCVLTAMYVSSASAQNAGGEQQQKVLEQELEEVMVSAARIETPLNQSAKLITVITKEDIQRAPVRSIQDLLVYSATVDILQRGGHGVQADISIRGGTFDQTAILLNGVNLTNAQTGHYSFDLPVNLFDIERIEIIHGPSALVYGSSAFAGGINIITKKHADTRLYTHIGAGMHNLRDLEVRGTTQTGMASHSLSAGYKSSTGYIANSDYDIYNLFWQTRLNLPDANKLDINLGYNDKKYGANTFYTAAWPNQYEHTSSYVGSVKGEFGTKLKIIPILYWNRHHDQFDLIRGDTYGRNYHRNDTYGGNLIFTYTSFWGTTSLGGEFRKEDIMSTVLGKEMVQPHRKYTQYDDRINTSVALEHTARWHQVMLSAGALMNHNTLLKNKYRFYPSLNLSYRPLDEIKLYTSWTKSTRMPSFTDLYYTTETHEGNEGLQPENSQAWELGIKYRKDNISAYLTGFMLWGRNIIDWVYNEEDDKSKSWNLTEIDTRGVEMGVKFHLYNWIPVLGESSALALDYTRMHQSTDTQGLETLYSLKYLRDKFTVKINHQLFSDFTMDWYFRFQKRIGNYKYYEDNVDTKKFRPYRGFSTLDVKLNYRHKDIGLNLTLNNLYNTHYFDLGNIPQAGFWLTGGITYTLK
ncbi:MAG: TonB-dependent receptor [Tannerellaceae bacterium]|nr:TonB-dependent receptor [Tannerellaceae bacterium]